MATNSTKQEAASIIRPMERNPCRGPFSEIVYATLGGFDPSLARRSMELMTSEVLPRVNRALRE